MNRTITAYFDSRTDAQLAAERLAAVGIPAMDVSIRDSDSTTADGAAGDEDKGFWASIGDLFMPDEDRYSYEEGIRRGGSVMTVRAENADFDRICDTLEESGAADMDGREAEWRSEGWAGYDSGRQTGDGKDKDYLPVAEEQLHVGKREVDHGRVRIRSYVREEPVEEQIRLRDEKIDIERTPVDRAATPDDNLFEERTIEAEAHGEEPVVSKEARITEEARLSKHVEDRDETIRDTVRRTEIEVDDEGTGLTDEERARRDGR